MKPSEILKKGLERLGPNGEHWSGTNHPGKDCITLSLSWLGLDDEQKGLDVLRKLFKADNLYPIWAWNDEPNRTFPEVKLKFLEAIKLAEAEEALNA